MMNSSDDIDHQNVKSGSISSNRSTTTVTPSSSTHPHDLSSDRTTAEQLHLQPVPPPPNFLDTFPMGYRFNPTNKEVLDYLNLRVEKKELPPNKFNEINLYDHHPEYLTSERFKAYENKEWYFFTPRDRKYRNGSRPKRAAGSGFWKATRVDKEIFRDNDKEEKLGKKKTLVFYEGKPPKGTKTCWVMHEFKVEKSTIRKNSRADMRLDDCVLCRIQIKKKINKSTDSTTTSSTSSGSRKRSRSVHNHSLSSLGEDDPQVLNDGSNMGNLQQDLHLPEEQQEEDALSTGVADVYIDEDVHQLYGSRTHQHYHPTEDRTILNNNASLIMGTAVSSSTTVVRGAVMPPLQTCSPSPSWITAPVGHNDYYLYACSGTAAAPDMVSVSAIHNSHHNNIQQGYDQNQYQIQRQWDYSNHMLMNSSSSSVPAGRPALLIPRPQQVFHVPVHCGPPPPPQMPQMQQIQQQDYHQQYSYRADGNNIDGSSSSRNKVVYDHAIRAAAECRERHMVVFKENDNNNTNTNEQHPDYYAGVNQECFETPYSMILNDTSSIYFTGFS